MAWYNVFISPVTIFFEALKGLFSYKTVAKIEDITKDAGPIIHDVIKGGAEGQRYKAIGEIESAVQQYSTPFVKDGRTTIASIAVIFIVLFIMGWLPQAAYGTLPPVIMEMCKWVEYYLGLTVGSATGITALNIWARSKLTRQQLAQAHEIEILDRNNNGVPDSEEFVKQSSKEDSKGE